MTKNNKKFIPDILPVKETSRSTQGKVRISLDESTQVMIVGTLYGMEHSIQSDSFSAQLFLDHYNRRIKIVSYETKDFHGLIMKIRWLAENNNMNKIICYANRQDFQRFLNHGYVLEGILKYYHLGEDAYIVSKFRDQGRLHSPYLMEEILSIEAIMEAPIPKYGPIETPGFTYRPAQKNDIPKIIKLYESIFDSYPTPLTHPDYLDSIFMKEGLFHLAIDEKGEIAASASAELNNDKKAAELTDCATRPDYRGKHLMSNLLYYLEQELIKRKFICSYTLARARSFGMNRVFFQLGHEFSGRLINNCDIYGAFEDMNLWVKKLPQKNLEENLKENQGSSKL